MTYTAADIDELVKKLRYDLSAAQVKLSELATAAGALIPPAAYLDTPRCPVCGPMPGLDERRLAEHIRNIHPAAAGGDGDREPGDGDAVSRSETPEPST